jgi:hypothetical protein
MAKFKVRDADTGEEKEVEGVTSGWAGTGIGAGIGALGGLGGALIGAGIGTLTGNADGYKVNNLFRKGTAKQLNALIGFVADKGYFPSTEETASYLGLSVTDPAVANLRTDLQTFLDKNNVAYNGATDVGSPQDQAFNQYFDQIYSTDAGTLGGDIYNNLVNIERNNAIANMELAEAQAQQLSMAQAEQTKVLADQVRAERMAKLRAGMNEAQIANQDMQAMMNNIQARNQQVAATNAAKLQAAQQYNLAQDTAYQQWLQNANTMGQTGAAYAASDAGDAMAQARAYAAATRVPLSQAYKIVTGSTK